MTDPEYPDTDRWLDTALSRLHHDLAADLSQLPIPEHIRPPADPDLAGCLPDLTSDRRPDPVAAITTQTDLITAMPAQQRLVFQSALPPRELAAIATTGRLIADAEIAANLLTHCAPDLRDVRRTLLDLDYALTVADELTLTHARDIARQLAGTGEPAPARRLIAGLLDELERALGVALARPLLTLFAQEATTGLGRALALSLGANRDSTTNRRLTTAITKLTTIATDFTDADLTSATLDGIQLRGIRWTTTTAWPTGLEPVIHEASTRLGNGTFEIRETPLFHRTLSRSG